MVISIFCVLFHQLTSNWLLFWLVYFCVAVVLSIGKCGSGLFPTREIVFTKSFFFHHENFVLFSVVFWFLFFVVVIKLIWKSGKVLTCASTQHCLTCFVRVLNIGWNSNFRISSNCSSIELRIYIYIYFPDSNSRATLCAIVIVIACDFVYFTAMRTR